MKPSTKPLAILLAAAFGLSLLGMIFATLGRVPVAYAATIIVNTTADELINNGNCSLREAIRAANLDTAVDACTPGAGVDLIQFNFTTPATITLTLGELQIYNGGLILEGPGAELLTLSGNQQSRILHVSQNVPLTLSGLTLTGGSTVNDGGALLSEGEVTISGARFVQNEAGDDGGAIQVARSLTMIHTAVLSNTAAGEGGGVAVYGPTTLIEDSVLSGNHSGSFGGALYADRALTMARTQVSHNSAQIFAGGAWVWQSAVLTDTHFSHNQAQMDSIGALYVNVNLSLNQATFQHNQAAQRAGAVQVGGDLTGTNNMFSGNVATYGRAGALEVRGNLWLTATQFLDNSAATVGGAIYHSGPNGAIYNSLLAGNTAVTHGTALYANQTGATSLVHNTIVGPAAGDGTAVYQANSGSLSLTNNIIVSSTVGLELANGTASEDYNLFYQTTPVSGTAVFGPHSFSGDPAFADPAAHNYRLTTLSEAINMGTDLGLAEDFEGNPRPSGGGVEIGFAESSYESDLAVSKTAVSSPAIGAAITYTITIANVGDAMLPQITLTDHIPAAIIPLTFTSNVTWSQLITGSDVTAHLARLAPGDSAELVIGGIFGDVLPRGSITNTAVAHTNATEINLDNNQDDAIVVVPNYAPIAVDDSFTTPEDVPMLLSPLDNDLDGDILSITAFDSPTLGTAVLSGSQTILFTPTLNLHGSEQIAYTVSDGLLSDTGIITLTVTAVNDPPEISAGETITVSMSEDSDPTPFALMLTASDVENDPLTWRVSGAASYGEAAAVPGPATSSLISYTPDEHYFGSDQFTVEVSDGALIDTIVVQLVIASVNDAPEAADDYAVVLRQPSGDITVLATGSTGMLNVLDNDSDVENDPLTVSAYGSPSQGGTTTLGSSGSLQAYAPLPTFVGMETVSYTVSDGDLTDTAVLHLTVANGLAGGIGGDRFAVAGLGEDGTFTVDATLPANLAAGANVGLILDQAAENISAQTAALLPAAPPGGFVSAGLSFSLVPYLDGQPMAENYHFAEPVTLSLSYPQAGVADIGPSENSLALYFAGPDGWSTSGVQVVERDLVNHRLVITVDHGGTFTLFRLGFIFIPLVLNNYVHAPDLIVESLTVLSAGSANAAGDVQIVIKNIGTAPVTEEFWVDLYIDPHTVPTAVNQTWEMMGSQGAAWGILADALPLAPGESLTLTLASPYFSANDSRIVWPLPAAAPLYVQVDANNPGSSSGAVLELHEIIGGPYNNIFAPR